MEIFAPGKFKRLSNPGVTSEQLISPHISSSTRVTVTRVTVDPGAVQGRHQHNTSEQIWLALDGSGDLLLADSARRAFSAGEVARFEDGDIHGFENTGSETFVYLAVTAPPIDFEQAYERSE